MTTIYVPVLVVRIRKRWKMVPSHTVFQDRDKARKEIEKMVSWAIALNQADEYFYDLQTISFDETRLSRERTNNEETGND